MKIGELARAAGLTPKTLRYYEQVGLLPAPQRTDSGYRRYDPENLELLEFIQKAKALGLSLEEIREVLALREQGQAPCIHVLALLDQKLQRVETVLRDLTGFRDELVRLRAESQARLERLPAEARICGIIEGGIHANGEVVLAWLEGPPRKKPGLRAPIPKARQRREDLGYEPARSPEERLEGRDER